MANYKTNRKQIEVLTAERFELAVTECVRIMTQEPGLWDRSTNPMSECFGKLGTMSPLNRAAFVECFGEEQAERIEDTARAILAAKEERRAASNYAAHEAEADKAQGVPALGSFVWGFSSCLKADDRRGIFGEIERSIEYGEKYPERPRLCRVDKVITVTTEEFNNPRTADELAEAEQLPGGCWSDDVDESKNWEQLTEEENATFYTLGAVITDGVRWFLADPEGHNYPRYIYKPSNWREMYAAEVEQVEQAIAEEEERERIEAERKAAERRAAYLEKVAKWSHLMQDVRPYQDAEKEARGASGYYRKGSAERKAAQAAERKTNSVRRANILAMCSAAFPGLKFRLIHCQEWGASWRVSWTDGPTVEEFNAATDLQLFARYFDTFDGMTDYADTVRPEFTDFATQFMGEDNGQIETEREMSPECRECVAGAVRDALGEDMTDGQDLAINQFFAARDALAQLNPECKDLEHWHCRTFSELVRQVWHRVSFYTAPTQPTTPTTPDNGGKGGKATEPEQVESEGTTTAPEGLQLVAIAEGVAVVPVVADDTRATYRNRKAIKAHGAKWNKEAQQWQATDPESVAALRKWFGLSDEQPTTEEVTEAEDPMVFAKQVHQQAADNYNEFFASCIAEGYGDLVTMQQSWDDAWNTRKMPFGELSNTSIALKCFACAVMDGRTPAQAATALHYLEDWSEDVPVFYPDLAPIRDYLGLDVVYGTLNLVNSGRLKEYDENDPDQMTNGRNTIYNYVCAQYNRMEL